MKNPIKRLDGLTASPQLRAAVAPPPPKPFIVWHRGRQWPGQTEEEAFDAYGRDRIGPDDGVFFRRILPCRTDS